MQVICAKTLGELDELESDWCAAHARDPHAHLFSSWDWMRANLETKEEPWWVLAARPRGSNHCVAFAAFAKKPAQGWFPSSALRMAGKPFSDYTGFVCTEGYERSAIPTLAAYVQGCLDPAAIYLEDVRDPRLDLFTSAFCGDEFLIRHARPISAPRIALPNSWERYLQECLSAKARYHLRRCIRRVETNREVALREADASTLDAYTEAFLTMWRARWGVRPRDEAMLRHMLQRTQQAGLLWFQMLWIGEKPLAGLVAYREPRLKTVYCHMTAFDDASSEMAPGKAMFGLAIRKAIESGDEQFDLLLGSEDYKLSRLGATSSFVNNTLLVRRNLLRRTRCSVPLVRPITRSRRAAAWSPSGRFHVGQSVLVRPPGEQRSLEGAPPFKNGQHQRIAKIVHNYFDEKSGRMLRCDGAIVMPPPHGSSAKHRLWPTSCLVDLDEQGAPRDRVLNAPSSIGVELEEPLVNKAKRWLRPLHQHLEVTREALRKRLRDVLSETARQHLRQVIFALSPRPPRDYEASVEPSRPGPGNDSKAPPPELHVGDRVRIEMAAVLEALQAQSSCGCSLSSPCAHESMLRFCGRELVVRSRIRAEPAGAGQPGEDSFTLHDAFCDGSGTGATSGCDRMCYLTWRARWLELIAPASESVSTAGPTAAEKPVEHEMPSGELAGGSASTLSDAIEPQQRSSAS